MWGGGRGCIVESDRRMKDSFASAHILDDARDDEGSCESLADVDSEEGEERGGRADVMNR